MSRKVHVISGLLTPSVSEDVFLNTLVGEGFELAGRPEPLKKSHGIKVQKKSAVVFILPILGDNDLLPFQSHLLEDFLKAYSLAGCKVIIVLKGDRHASDEFVMHDYSIHIKLKNLFKHISCFTIIDIKLDEDTAVRIAYQVANELDNPLPAHCEELDLLAKVIGRQPAWDSASRHLDFGNEISGYSLLYGKSKLALSEIVNISRLLDPRSISIDHAHIPVSDFELLPTLPTVLKAQLSSNNLTLESVLSAFPSCKWINLAANQLEDFSLTSSVARLESVLVHKNCLREVNIGLDLPSQLKMVSVYRNQISSFEWPKDQKSLEVINLGANPISEIPESLAHSENIKSLGLARTKVTHLPDWVFSLPKLESVDISHIEDQIPYNQLEKLKDMGVHLLKKPG